MSQAVFSMGWCLLKLDEKKSKDVGFRSTKWFWPNIFAEVVEGV
jgi:hypothetical protein